jgi:hypothetical protein
MSLKRSETTVWLGVFCLCVFLLFHGGHFYHVDEELHFLIANSILDGNGGAIPPEQQGYYRGQPVGVHSFLPLGKFGPDGRFYVKSGIGQPITVLPLAWFARWVARMTSDSNRAAFERFIASLFCPILAAAAAAVSFQFLLNMGWRRRVALAVVFSAAFGTFYFAQAKFFMNHMLVAVLLILGLYCVQLSQRGALTTMFAAGILAGWMVLTRVDALPHAALIPLYAASIRGSSKKLQSCGVMGLGFALTMLILGYWNNQRFGSPFDLGYNLTDPSQPNYDPFDAPFLTGFFGQLFNLQTGLLWFAPPLIVSLAGVRASYHRDSGFVVTALFSLLLPLAFYATFSNWAGEISWGPRFLLPGILVIAILAAPIWQEYFDRGRHRAFLYTICAIGFLVQVCGVLADHNRGFLLTMQRIAERPVYQYLPYNRVIAQLELLIERPPDLWWIATLNQGSPVEKFFACFLLVTIATGLALAGRSLWYNCSLSKVQSPGS